MREVRFYRSASDSCPVQDFLDSQPSKVVQKIAWVLRLIEDLDTVPAQYFKKLRGTDELWEVRAQYGGDTFRLLGFFDGTNFVILTNGFAKKTNKVPRQEIQLAQQRRREHLNRSSSHE